jgi:hypothetical protein
MVLAVNGSPGGIEEKRRWTNGGDYSWKVVYGGENHGWERKINDLWRGKEAEPWLLRG